MNVAYLENRSTTTRIDPYSPTLGNPEIQSMETLSQGLWGTGKGSNSPIGLSRSMLVNEACLEHRHACSASNIPFQARPTCDASQDGQPIECHGTLL